MDDHDGNVAFKCTYNDGGDSGYLGFEGTCTNGNIIRNVKKGRRWCSHSENPCRQFYEADFRGRRPRNPCYESQIFTRWGFGPGKYHSEDRDGDPIPMKLAREGRVALLTTRHPEHDRENQRIVFGVFEIVERSEDDNGEIWLRGEPGSAIRVPESAALALPYWRFKAYPGSGKADWGSGLFRSVSDQEVSNFLHALAPFLQNAQDRMTLESLLACCGNLTPDIGGANPDVEIPDADLKTKYGPGGEGEPHRRLKEFIAENPDRLNLGPGTTRIEHRFMTGDRVDVAVDLDNGERCVVEIEVAGQSTLIGAHQALKYRALRAGQLNTRRQPHAFLVAYTIPKNVKKFCKRHGVSALEVQPD